MYEKYDGCFLNDNIEDQVKLQSCTDCRGVYTEHKYNCDIQ